MSAAPTPPATPIFDAVDRWWREGGDEPAPATILSFPGSTREPRRPVRVSTTSDPRHLLR
ncbi:hypothetical protein [Actinomycetospora sp. TBRC 11914]|uniref:hypothetical protein n=1 Tax=Actinomycetospora sp. TBRC 11914 TaxID=2729387 RepID=UPI00145EAC97|nr:hypothetical protein [Actinomycetospora sp. TBRC 11914]NMO94130.1 hypothetical protein [Actinomycetospora sp. TBRC 11914]